MARMGRLRGRVTEAELKEFLERSGGASAAGGNKSSGGGSGGSGGAGGAGDEAGRVVFSRRAREDDDLDLELEMGVE